MISTGAEKQSVANIDFYPFSCSGAVSPIHFQQLHINSMWRAPSTVSSFISLPSAACWEVKDTVSAGEEADVDACMKRELWLRKKGGKHRLPHHGLPLNDFQTFDMV